jgi:hypothetical protein
VLPKNMLPSIICTPARYHGARRSICTVSYTTQGLSPGQAAALRRHERIDGTRMPLSVIAQSDCRLPSLRPPAPNAVIIDFADCAARSRQIIEMGYCLARCHPEKPGSDRASK